MTSYMAQLSLGHFCKDVPDFLTCGFCAKEFLLENITLFIAHKFGCADKTPLTPDIEDTTSPLTCSVCSRVFMTARGLLQHVQLDHKMKIYLQKGPLLISNVSAGLPPPAHLLPTKGGDYSTTNTPNCLGGPLEICETEQPTDLSLSCQAPGEQSPDFEDKDRAFKITDDVGAKEKTPYSFSALPKKRKFLLQENGQEASPVSARTPSLCSSESVAGEDIGEFNNDNQESCKEVLPSNLSVESYRSKDFTGAGRNEKERHAKLKELLQRGKTSEPDAQLGDTFSSVSLKQEPEEVSDDAPTKTAVDGRVIRSESAATSMTQNARFKPGFTNEQNIEQLIRTSVSDDSFCDDYGINTKQPPVTREAFSDVPLSTAALSQRLNTPGGIYTPYMQTEINSDLSPKTYTNLGHLVPPKLEDSPFNLCLNQSSPYALTKLPTPSTNQLMTSAQRPTFYCGKSYSFSGRPSTSFEPPSDQKHHPKPTLETQLSDPSGHAHYQRRVAAVKDSSPSRRFQHHRHSSDEKTFTGQHLFHARSFEPQPLSYVNGQILLENANEKEDYPNIVEKRNNTGVATQGVGQFRHTPLFRSQSESLEETGIQTTTTMDGQSRMDTDELQILDARLMKKRRYPTSRPFKCIHCDQAFNQRIHLKKHMSKHTGVKPFKCQQCDYSTVERSHLKVHYRIHTGEKPYRCLYCDYATAQNSTLKIHLKRHHEGINSISSQGRDSFLAQGIREDEDNLLNDSYTLGLSTDSEGRAASVLGQEYPSTFSDPGRSDYTTTGHSKLDSVVGHFSFFSKEKDNSFHYSKNSFMNHMNNPMPQALFDSKNIRLDKMVITDHIDPSRVNFQKSQQCNVSNSVLMRNVMKTVVKESISENNIIRSTDKSPIKTSEVDTVYQNKNEYCDKACPLQNIEIQTTPKQDYRSNLALQSPVPLNPGKDFSPSAGKDIITTHCKDYQVMKNGLNMQMKEIGLHPHNYMTEQQSMYQAFTNVSTNVSQREPNLKEEESKEEVKYVDPYLKANDQQRAEQPINVVNNKCDHGLNQESFDDNGDESDLEYNIGLPTVNIPNKEFVRG